MTAEILILNKSAVALAADSARVLSVDDAECVYPSANKLFRLSDSQPVGLLAYGSGALMDLSWESAVALYRKKLGAAHFATLEEYAKDFLAFLAASLFTSAEQDQYFEQRVRFDFGSILERLKRAAKKKHLEKPTPDLLKADIDPLFDGLSALPKVPDFEARSVDIAGHYHGVITALRDDVFKEIDLSPEMKDKLAAIAPLYFNRERYRHATHVVIAGFGEEEKCPSYFHYEIEWVVLNTLKHRLVDRHSAEQSGPCLIPFAENSEILCFLEGIDPDTNSVVQDELERALESYRQRLDKSLHREAAPSAETDALIQEVRKGVLKDFNDTMDRYRLGNHSGPVLSSVRYMPKKDLATLAELLVRLTALKKRLTMAMPNVGGPIDVAVLSKEDGFVWVKKKSYFIPE